MGLQKNRKKSVDRFSLPEKWWEKSSGLIRFWLKREGMKIRDVIPKLDEVQSWGFDGIEIYAPYQSGTEYSGLDVIDYFRVDPVIGGEMDEFLELVNFAHQKHLAIIIDINLGYSALDCPIFLKACDDMRRGIDSPETHFFL